MTIINIKSRNDYFIFLFIFSCGDWWAGAKPVPWDWMGQRKDFQLQVRVNGALSKEASKAGKGGNETVLGDYLKSSALPRA